MQWTRKHDQPGSFIDLPIERKSLLEEFIDLCRVHPDQPALKAVGSHWALSRAAITDHTVIERIREAGGAA